MAKASKTYADKLRNDFKEERKFAVKTIVNCAKLIAPILYDDIIISYDWLIDVLKASNFPEAESELEINKAMAFIKRKEIDPAINSLKGFEKKDKTYMARASSNISCLYFVEGDFKNAEKYAEIAISHDRFNSNALVNKGNCLFINNDFMKAKEHFLEAIGVEADCIEALYNLAFVNKKLTQY